MAGNYSGILLVMVFCLTLTAFTIQTKEEGRKSFPGTSVSIIPPKHFDTTSLFKGFLHKPTSTSLVASKVENQNYIAFKSRLTDEYFKSQGLTLIKTEEIKTTNIEGVIYYTSFTVKEVAMERMMLVTGDYNDTYLVMANYPAMFNSNLVVPLRQSFLTVKFN